MKAKKLTNKQYAGIHNQALQAVAQLKNCEYDIIQILNKVDENKIYAYYGFRSAFQYAVSALQLTESQAYSYITVSRKSRVCKSIDQALKNKEISVSKIKQVIAHIDPENEAEWVDRAKNMTKRELEGLVAKINPRTRVPEHARIVAENLIHLQMPISEDKFKKFQRVSELLCQKTNSKVKMEDIIEELCDQYLERNDPLIQAERLLNKKMAEKRVEIVESEKKRVGLEAKDSSRGQLKEKKEKAEKRVVIVESEKERVSLEAKDSSRGLLKDNNFVQKYKVNIKDSHLKVSEKKHSRKVINEKRTRCNKDNSIFKSNRTLIPQNLKHIVYLRDQGQCQFKHENGQLCDEKRWIDYHHIKPLSKGGEHSLSNLTLLCRGHHRTVHCFD